MLSFLNLEWRPGWPRPRWFNTSDAWLLVWTLGTSTLGALAIAVTDLETTSAVSGWTAWGILIGLPLAAYVALGVFIIGKRWASTAKDDAPGTEENPAFHAAFLLLFGMLSILAWIAFGPNVPLAAWPWPVDLTHPVQRGIYLGAVGIAFLPLLYGFHCVATEAGGKGHRNYLKHPEGPVGMSTLLSGAAVICAIGTGAWAAGEQVFSMEQNFGLVIMALVVMGFLAFIFLPHLSSLIGERDDPDEPKIAQAGFAGHPGHIVSGIDATMVRLLAPLSGATQGGWMVPQLILLLVMLPLSAMGYALPHPWGLAPIAIAALIIFGLGRRWAWVEDDREKALRIQTTRSDQFRIGFANDLRDEALMGYAWLFILVPLALRQIQMHFDLFEPVDPMILAGAAQSTGLVEWLKFFGTELAKGVPIVDWVDIYDVTQEEPFVPKGAAARHIVFISRLLVDVVLIAALLQAFGIMQRNKAQKRLFEAGQIDFFDPFMERRILRESYRKPGADGIPMKARALDFFAAHLAKSKELDRGEYYYNTRRLNELYTDKDDRVRTVAQWLARDLVVGSVTERMAKLAEMFSDTPQEKREEADWARKFYRYVDDVIADARASRAYWQMEDSKRLSRLLGLISEDREFDHVRARAFALLGKRDSLHAAKALAARLVRPEHAATLPEISATTAPDWHFRRQRRQPERVLAAEQLFKIRLNIEERKNGTGSATLAFIDAVIAYVRDEGGKGEQF